MPIKMLKKRDHILYDSIPREWKCIEKIDLWLLRAGRWVGGEDKEMTAKGIEGFF